MNQHIRKANPGQLDAYDIVELYNQPDLEGKVREFLTEKPKKPRIVFCNFAILRGYEVKNFVLILLEGEYAFEEFISRWGNIPLIILIKYFKKVESL